MLQIECPWCGVRDEDEFRYGGEGYAARPGLDADDAHWNNYLFNRRNPRGLQDERWVHVYGCNRWFKVVRDTVSHEIVAVHRLGNSP